MGIADDEEQGPSSPGVDETLPLYEDLTKGDDITNLDPPDPKATPDEVRDFLVQIMQPRVGIDHARRIAASWKMGSGRELQKYPAPMYRDIFGTEDGWVVYKEVMSLIYRKKKDKNRMTRSGWITGIVSAVLLLGGAIAVFSFLEDLWFVLGFFMFMIGGLVSVVLIAIACVQCRDPEERAENDLNAHYYKSLGGQSNN